jgi:hypothetical protein
MKKNQKILLGVAILGVGGYLYWKSTQPKKTFANVSGFKCPVGKQKYQIGVNEFVCIDPRGYSPSSRVKKVND